MTNANHEHVPKQPLPKFCRDQYAMSDHSCKELAAQADVLGGAKGGGGQLWTASAANVQGVTFLRQPKEAEESRLHTGWQISQPGDSNAELLRLGVHASVPPAARILTPVTVHHGPQRLQQQDMAPQPVQRAWPSLPDDGQMAQSHQQHQNSQMLETQVRHGSITDLSNLTTESRNSLLQRINQNQDTFKREIARLETLKHEVIIAGVCSPNLEQDASQVDNVIPISDVRQDATLIPQDFQIQATVDYPEVVEPSLRNSVTTHSQPQLQCILSPESHEDTGGGVVAQKVWLQNAVGPETIELRAQLCEQDSMEVARKLIDVLVQHTHNNSMQEQTGMGNLGDERTLDYQLALIKKLKGAFVQLDPNAQDQVRSLIAALANTSAIMEDEMTICDPQSSGKPTALQLNTTIVPQAITADSNRCAVSTQNLASLMSQPHGSQDACEAALSIPLYEQLAGVRENWISATPVLECVPNVSRAPLYENVKFRAEV